MAGERCLPLRPEGEAAVYSIDTPPPTVSGKLHLGHVYSYSHADFVARFWRMNGYNVFYPMGFDDNGLPTERLVERTSGHKGAGYRTCRHSSKNAWQSARRRKRITTIVDHAWVFPLIGATATAP